MKQIFTLLITLMSAWSMSFAQIALPYAEDLEAEPTGGVNCGDAQVFTNINWTNSVADDLDWVIDVGGTVSSLTGPSNDYNPGTATGKYLYVETTSPCFGGGQQAVVESDEFYSNGTEPNLFFEFAYHLYGSTMGDLEINIREVSGGLPGPWTGLDTLSGDQGNAWIIANYDLTSFIGDTFQIQFVCTVGSNFYSDMALDDFKIFSILPDDAGILSIDGPVSPAPSGPNNFAVTIQNFGVNNLTTAMINWELNGVLQTPFNYVAPLTGLPTGAQEGGVVIGNQNLGTGVFTVKAWPTMPNGVPDVVAVNDTAFATGCSGALRGTYTLGGPSADFADFSSLGFVLSNCGIDSHTVINVNPGFYAERLVLETVPGTADTATLTIDGGDATLATISNGTFSTIYLNGTDFTTIKNLTIEATGTLDCYGVQLRDSAFMNTIDSCVIVMNDSTVGLADVVGVSASNLETSTTSEELNAFFTTVSNCTIIGGDKGIHYEGDFGNGNRNVGNAAINNVLLNQEDYGIYVDEQDSLTIVGNTISGLRNVNADGMLLFDIMMFNISGNNVVAPDYGINIEDGNFETTPTSRGKIFNNMIVSTADRGLDIDDINDTDIFHNTVATTNSLGSSGTFYTNDLTNCDIRNNIFYNDGSAFAWYSLDDLITVGNNSIDYNIYFTTGSDLIDAPAVYTDLAAWQAAQPTLNANSLETDPLFLNGINDLHLFAPNLDDLGDNSAGVLVDIDGDSRPAGTNVDIGADEFTPLQDDAGVSAIENPVSPATVGLNDVIVAVSNYGADTLESVNIEWELDGILQTPYAHTDSLLSGDTRSGIIIGSTSVAAGVVYTIKAWTTLPNGVADIQNGNDTTEISGCGALRGIYTVGGAGADFPDLTTLSNILSSCGIDSTTIININPGIYNERLLLENVPGTNDTTTLTINGGSIDSVTISNNNLATVVLQNTHYTTIKNVTIENTASSNAYGVQLRDSASYNVIDSCFIAVDSSGTTTLACGVCASDSETSAATSGRNAWWNTVSNNTIRGAYYGVRFQGAVAEQDRNVGNSIINNEFIDQYYYCTYNQYQDSMSIVGNTMNPTLNNLGDGIYMLDVQEFDISGNNVQANDWGIYIADGNFDFPATSRGKIINNMTYSSTDRGLALDDVNDVDIFHNTVAASNTGTNGAFYSNDITGLDVRNNIFYADGAFAYYSLDAISGGSGNFFDYNVYFSTGATLLDVGPQYVDLAAWQTATPAWNVNSIQGDPIFISNFDDLHLVGAAANDVGDNAVGVTVDIDGEFRPQAPSLTVDAGADEYTPLLRDAVAVEFLGFDSNCGDNVTDVRVLIRNFGQLDITNLPITVNYSGPSTGTLNFTYTNTLAFGEYDTVNVGFINTFDGGTFTFDGYTNLAGDEDLSSDTFPIFTQTFTPVLPQGINGYGCGTDQALLEAVQFPGAGFEWFNTNDPLDTIPVGTGPNYVVPSIAAQDTYYLGYADNADSLFVSLAGGNGNAGNMFDIAAINDVNITGFDVHIGSTGTETVEIYGTPNTFVGKETNAGAWTLLATTTVTANGAGNLTPLPDNIINVTIPAGQSYGFYVTLTTSTNIDYTNGTAVGNLWAQNADIQVLEGVGKAYPFGTTNTTRNWNGQVHYGSTACSNQRVPVAAIPSPGVSVDLGNDTLVCGTSLDLDAGTNADFYTWSTNDSVQMITVTSSGQYDVAVSDSLGCIANDVIDVTIQTPPVVAVGNDTTLCGDMFTIDATVDSSWSYLWSNGDTTFSVMANSSNTYAVTVTDTVGCTDTDSLVLTLNPNPSVDLGNDSTLCGNLELNAGNPGASYNWSTGDTARAIMVNTTDQYSVVVSDANGCEGTDSVDLTFLPDAILDTAATACGSYTWIDGNTYIADTLVSFVIVGGAANGCDSVINLDLDITIIDTTVTQAGATLTANAVGVTYQWVDCDNGNFAIAGATAQSFSATANGNYAVQITDNGCVVQTSCVNVTGLSIRGFGDASVMNLYPNPTENMVTIDFGSVMKNLSLRVMTVDGRTMQAHNAVDGQFFELSLADYPQGLYFVEVTAEDGTVTSLKVSKF